MHSFAGRVLGPLTVAGAVVVALCACSESTNEVASFERTQVSQDQLPSAISKLSGGDLGLIEGSTRLAGTFEETSYFIARGSDGGGGTFCLFIYASDSEWVSSCSDTTEISARLEGISEARLVPGAVVPQGDESWTPLTDVIVRPL